MDAKLRRSGKICPVVACAVPVLPRMGRATHGLPPRSSLPHHLNKSDNFKQLTHIHQKSHKLLSDVANLGIRASLCVLFMSYLQDAFFCKVTRSIRSNSLWADPISIRHHSALFGTAQRPQRPILLSRHSSAQQWGVVPAHWTSEQRRAIQWRLWAKCGKWNAVITCNYNETCTNHFNHAPKDLWSTWSLSDLSSFLALIGTKLSQVASVVKCWSMTLATASS